MKFSTIVQIGKLLLHATPHTFKNHPSQKLRRRLIRCGKPINDFTALVNFDLSFS